jgi:hypothetical protein
LNLNLGVFRCQTCREYQGNRLMENIHRVAEGLG